eukprot:scaffold24636_cov31-Tisochrysis_lutea.AAC.3
MRSQGRQGLPPTRALPDNAAPEIRQRIGRVQHRSAQGSALPPRLHREAAARQEPALAFLGSHGGRRRRRILLAPSSTVGEGPREHPCKEREAARQAAAVRHPPSLRWRLCLSV